MRVVSQCFEFLHWPDYAAKLIEDVGRTAYKSHEKMSDGSADRFIKGLINQHPMHKAPLEFADIVVRVKTCRDVSHELVRHRIASYLQESQRYVKYSNGDMEFIKPAWAGDFFNGFDMWKETMREAEAKYAYMVEGLGMKPQQARTILPNSTATVICIKKNILAWRETFDLRLRPNVYPETRSLMTSIFLEMHKRLPVAFADMVDLAEAAVADVPLVDSVL